MRLTAASCLAALALAGSAAAQTMPPADLAQLALDVCIRADPDASEGVRAPGFSIRERLGRTAIYENEAGATLTLTAQPSFFACEMRVPEAGPGYLDALLAELAPAIDERFGETDVGSSEDGMIWVTTTGEDVLVTVEVLRSEDGEVSITSSADDAPIAPPTQ